MLAATFPNRREALALDSIHDLVEGQFQWSERLARCNLGDARFGNSLLSGQLKKCRMALTCSPPSQFKRPDILYMVSPMNRNPLLLHPTIIERLFPPTARRFILGCRAIRLIFITFRHANASPKPSFRILRDP